MEQINHINSVSNSYFSNNKSWLCTFAYIFMAYWRESKKLGVIYYHE